MKNMNKFKIIVAGLLMVVAFSACKKDLPYPIDQVTRGAVIDITKVAGTDADMKLDGTGNTAVQLQTVKYAEGEYVSVRVSCLYVNDVTEEEKYVTVQDNITTLPANITINYNNLKSTLGLTPAVGDYFYFFVDVILPDGKIINGYNIYTGVINNNDFAAYSVDGTAAGRKLSRYVYYRGQ